MTDIKLTKNGLRDQERKLAQLSKYLPTLKLKKAMLQLEVNEARIEIKRLQDHFESEKSRTDSYVHLLTEKGIIDPEEATRVVEVKKGYENVAGIEVPVLDSVRFGEITYSLYDVPPWVDGVVFRLRELRKILVEIDVAREKKAALEHELRQVAIRVNLFEKVLIPRAQANIKKIKVFLGDQQLASIGQVKVAKTKIEERAARWQS